MSIAERLRQQLPETRVSDAAPDRELYARDLWPRALIDVRRGHVAPSAPGAVIWPRSPAEVARIVKLCAKWQVALVPYGAGSGVCAAIQPDAHTVVLDLKLLRDFVVTPDIPEVDVGAGALGLSFEEALQREGFTTGHFPSSIVCSTVGGWVAARGAGQCSGRYGKIEDMVTWLECVDGRGDVYRLRARSRQPNLVPLFIGSEGILGVITRVGLRLHPAPTERAFAAMSFDSFAAGIAMLRELYQRGLRPAVSRLYDPLDSALFVKSSSEDHGPPSDLSLLSAAAIQLPRAVDALTRVLERSALLRSTLLLVFEGSAGEARADAQIASDIRAELGGKSLGEAPARAWFDHRYSVSYRQAPVFRSGAFSDTMEVAAPWSQLEGVYEAVRSAIGSRVLVMAHLSHAYPEGCSIYFTFSGRESSEQRSLRLYDDTWNRALEAARSRGATLSHHHGVGRSKAAHLVRELGHGVELIRRVKHACDPAGILNPGNLLPSEPFALSEPPSANDEPPFVLDAISQLVDASAEQSLDTLENWLRGHGLTLAFQPLLEFDTSRTLADWVESGCPGAPDRWEDPVAQIVVGMVARLHDGRILKVDPAPRRAVGPDLKALFIGTQGAVADAALGRDSSAGGAIGSIERVTFALRRRGPSYLRPLQVAVERDPAPSAAEVELFRRVRESILA